MPWNDLANNQTISFTNLKDAVDTGVFAQKTTVPVSNEQITKSEAAGYVWVNTSFGPFASKASNQLVVKSNMECAVPVTNTQDLIWYGIANNETTSSPIQLLAGRSNLGGGRISRSTDYGQNYSNVLVISDRIWDIKFMSAFRHASYLTVPPFLGVGVNGRIVTNSVTDCSSWVTISSPTSQDLYGIAFNSSIGIIVGNQRILRTNTTLRINSWSIVNSNSNIWTDVASDGSNFVAVGINNSIITSNALGSTWTPRSVPPLTPSKDLQGVTYHTDGFWYVVGFDASTSSPYMIRSSDTGATWSIYMPTDFALFDGPLYSIASISGRLVIGGLNYQYQIRNDVVTRCGASTGGVSISWQGIVKNAASSSGFNMGGFGSSSIGAYSNF